MNAHKFVAEKGIDEAKRVLNGAPKNSNWFQEKGKYSNDLFSCNHEIYGEAVMLSELKQVVESLDMVAKHGGLFCLKCQIEKGGYDFEWYGENGEFGFTELNVLEKAIADYELVESYKQEKCEILDMVDVSPNCKKIGG